MTKCCEGSSLGTVALGPLPKAREVKGPVKDPSIPSHSDQERLNTELMHSGKWAPALENDFAILR